MPKDIEDQSCECEGGSEGRHWELAGRRAAGSSRTGMRRRVLAAAAAASSSLAFCKYRCFNHFLSNSLLLLLPSSTTSLVDVICKGFAHSHRPCLGPVHATKVGLPNLPGHLWIHTAPSLNNVYKVEGPIKPSENNAVGDGAAKPKRKKLKGKRAVVRWLKFFRWKKKKEYERMTAEEKLLYKLRKARKKEERLVAAMKKIEPAESSETIHDPEVLTPEEHFFFLKMGLKCKNYVPVGRRGIYQGVILNMHLHWKKHQTLKVVVKTFSPDEVKEIAAELARLTGGIILDIHEENMIIMYRGKNYSQPPTEIMSPRVTLSRKKALDKSKYRDGLRAVRRYIPRLEQDLELLQAQAIGRGENRNTAVEETPKSNIDGAGSGRMAGMQLERAERVKEIIEGKDGFFEDDPSTDLDMASDSEDLSDMFETDSDTETKEMAKRPLYLGEFEKFPVVGGGPPDDLEEHLCQLSKSAKRDGESPTFDEVDRLFLRAASLLKKKKR